MHKQQDIRSAPKGPNRASNQPTKNTVNTGIHLAFFKTETHQRSRLFYSTKKPNSGSVYPFPTLQRFLAGAVTHSMQTPTPSLPKYYQPKFSSCMHVLSQPSHSPPKPPTAAGRGQVCAAAAVALLRPPPLCRLRSILPTK